MHTHVIVAFNSLVLVVNALRGGAIEGLSVSHHVSLARSASILQAEHLAVTSANWLQAIMVVPAWAN